MFTFSQRHQWHFSEHCDFHFTFIFKIVYLATETVDNNAVHSLTSHMVTVFHSVLSLEICALTAALLNSGEAVETQLQLAKKNTTKNKLLTKKLKKKKENRHINLDVFSVCVRVCYRVPGQKKESQLATWHLTKTPIISKLPLSRQHLFIMLKHQCFALLSLCAFANYCLSSLSKTHFIHLYICIHQQTNTLSYYHYWFQHWIWIEL